MNRSIAHHAMVLSLIGAVALGACSSDSDGGPTGTASPGTAATGAPPVATDATPAPTDAGPSDTTPVTPVATDGSTLTIKEFTFSDVTATSDQPFDISNQDGFAHTVTNRDGVFDVRVEGGTTESLTIDQPGTYEIFCRIHPSMSGTITVT